MMRPTETKISDFLQGKPCTMLMLAAALFAAVSGFGDSPPAPYLGDSGFAIPSPNNWFPEPAASFFIGLLLTAAVILLMEMLNRVFNILRTSSLMFIGVFAVMQCATPLIISRLTSALVLNVVVLAVLATFYTIYMKPRLTRRVFLAMAVMSALAMADYVYTIYIFLFLLAFGQMRCVTARMYLASLMGIATPWWIASGFGWIDLSSIHWPHPATVFSQFSKGQIIMFVITVGITVISQFLLCVSNMVKIYSYNAKARAISGLLMMFSLATAVAALVDFGNATAYISLLNCFTAFQIGQFYLINQQRRGYIAVLAALVIFSTIFVVNLWV